MGIKELKYLKDIKFCVPKNFQNKKILIYGAGMMFEEAFKNYDFSELNIVGISDKRFESENSPKEFCGLKTYAPEEINALNPDVILVAVKEYGSILNTLWQNFQIAIYPLFKVLPENDIREKWKAIIRSEAKSVGEGLWVGSESHVNSNTVLAEHVSFSGMRVNGSGNLKIGRYFHSGIECLIITQNHNYEGDEIPYDDKYIYKDVEIGDFVWLGSRVMILPGTKIGEGAIIQGGSVVHGEIPAYAIAGGNPAKVFKYRDIEHFKRLKNEGKFH